MALSLIQIFGIGIGYLSLFFLVAYLTDKGLLPARLIRHPAIYVLSLGVFASTWAIYGSVGFAATSGFNYLTYYIGISGAFMLAPMILQPILRLSQNYQLGSLADLLAFRYRSPLVGMLVTLCMLIAVVPLLASQIRAVSHSIHLLNPGSTPNTLAFIFCVIIILFSILFGARHLSIRDKHEGLVVAIAFESLIKLIAMITIGAIALFGVFGGGSGLQEWLTQHPEALEKLYSPLNEGPWRSLVFEFFVAAVTMPHMFHMAFTENLNPKALLAASWGLPLFLLILAIVVPIILWASIATGVDTRPDYYTLGLGLTMNSPALAILAFIAGLAAASGLTVVTTLALSAMCLKHLVLPVSQDRSRSNLYGWLLWAQRALIAAIVLTSYGFYSLVPESHSLYELSFLAFVATMQFVPGLFGVLIWPKANRKGFLAGLAAGIWVWFFLLILPRISGAQVALTLPFVDLGSFPTTDNMFFLATVSLIINAAVFTIISVVTKASPSETLAAETCTANKLRKPYRWELSAHSVGEFLDHLTVPLGKPTAEREISLALDDLAMSTDEIRPYALRRLRDQLETNLSGLLGPSVAQEIIDQSLPYTIHSEEEAAIEDIHFIESRLEEYHDKLTGLAAELDTLRRFHRQTLQDLPTGVCSLGTDGEVLGWNHAMENLTRIQASQVMGSNIRHLEPPWRALLNEVVTDTKSNNAQKEVEHEGIIRWLNIHKATLSSEGNRSPKGGLVIVIEDLTEIRSLENQLAHNARLASIGQLAAGVAHEIGNPVTGIACLAQNLRSETEDEYITSTSDQIMEQTRRISRIVQSLVSFSHSGHTRQIEEPVYIHEVVQEAIELVQLSEQGKNYLFRNETKVSHMVPGDSQRLLQVFVNLLNNAQDASQPAGTITVTSYAHEHSVTVDVTDDGCGIPTRIMEHIFEPFVTTKDPGTGTGLGMALVYSIIEDHQGHISINSPINANSGGTRVTITFPRKRKLDNAKVDEVHPVDD